jgi:DNA-binding NtrC family response regulator
MQTILIVDDDRSITEALAGGLEQPGRELILCSDLESAQLVIERTPPACIITDVRLTGPSGTKGSTSSPISSGMHRAVASS